jgi:IS605 OrfB family transposase
MYKTFKYRIKDSNSSLVSTLTEMGFAVNRVWNNANETQQKALALKSKYPSSFDLNNETAGWGKPLGIYSDTVQEVNQEYCTRLYQFKKPYLRWRSNRKSLTWIPFKARSIKIDKVTGAVRFLKNEFNLFYSRPIEGEIKTGSITKDARGRFYLNVVCKLPDFEGPIELNPVGVDLGLKSLATLSDGTSFGAQRYFRKYQSKLAMAQRAGKKKLARTIHAKISNKRKDFNHKVSNEITNEFSHILIGDVKSSDLIKTKIKGMAKSVYDVGWFQLKSFLLYKALAKGKICREVSEKWSTQACSECGSISKSSPKGRAGLNIREWTCPDCNTTHDRDVNAAKNILRSGLRSLQNNNLVTI